MMTVKTYRKKPVEVEGLLYTGHNDDEMSAFVGISYARPASKGNGAPSSNWLPAHHGQGAKVWNTSQYTWNDVNEGDTILRGLVGEFYPCSPDALAATYDEAVGVTTQEPGEGIWPMSIPRWAQDDHGYRHYLPGLCVDYGIDPTGKTFDELADEIYEAGRPWREMKRAVADAIDDLFVHARIPPALRKTSATTLPDTSGCHLLPATCSF